MSKTVDALSRLQSQRGPSPSPEEFENSNRGPERIGSAIAVIFWLSASIAATLFSYSLGVKQGQRNAQETASPRQWQYYYSDTERAEEPSRTSSETVAPAASAPKPKPVEASTASFAVPETGPEVPAVLQQGFTIQVVTYSSREMAQKEIERLEKSGFQAFSIPSGNYHQVCVNRYESKGKARQALTQFHADGHARTYPGAYVRPFGSR